MVFGGTWGLLFALVAYLAVHIAALLLQPLTPIGAAKSKLPALLVAAAGLLAVLAFVAGWLP
jgi:hypothetical protein